LKTQPKNDDVDDIKKRAEAHDRRTTERGNTFRTTTTTIDDADDADVESTLRRRAPAAKEEREGHA